MENEEILETLLLLKEGLLNGPFEHLCNILSEQIGVYEGKEFLKISKVEEHFLQTKGNTIDFEWGVKDWPESTTETYRKKMKKERLKAIDKSINYFQNGTQE